MESVEKTKKRKKSSRHEKRSSLRRSFGIRVIGTMLVVLILSVLTIYGGILFQNWLLPESEDLFLTLNIKYSDETKEQLSVRLDPSSDILKTNANGEHIFLYDSYNLTAEEVNRLLPTIQESMDEAKDMIVKNTILLEADGVTIQTEDFTEGVREEPAAQDSRTVESMDMSVNRVEKSYESLTPKRKLAYMGTYAAMILLPMCYSLTGVLLSFFRFYRRRLEPPIRILTDATEHISNQDLDFTVSYERKDELGRLCDAFEVMRQTLDENNRQLWNVLEARKILQASVAHDLRNPIAIIQGYAEYLQIHLKDGTLDMEQVEKTASNLEHAASRLERYTDSIRDVNQLEEMELKPVCCQLPDILQDMAEDFVLLGQRKGIEVKVVSACPSCRVKFDSQVMYRILENVVTNALRYARERITLEFTMEDKKLTAVITDDGCGFDQKVLKKQKGSLIMGAGEHMGMGLTVCQILCQKHKGELRLANRAERGAQVTIVIEVEKE